VSEPKPKQSIRYLRTADGVRLAWAEAGSGPTLVKAANWLTHLEYEWDSPVWRHWMHFLAGRFRFVRYDERGCGMTDWEVGDLSVATWLADLEAVVDAARPPGPVVLLGMSQGAAAAVAFAVHHPQRVSHLVLYGGYAQGVARRGDEGAERRYQAMIELAGHGWGSQNSTFRQVFTSRFIPGATDEQVRWFNELCAKTASPQNAVRLFEARATVDVTDLLPRVRTPTLVLHARDDGVTPIAQGRLLASSIPGAEFVELDSPNHILLEGSPAWRRFCEALVEFTGAGAPERSAEPAFAGLSPREREVLTLLSQGLANAEIGARLGISEKTVRNHLTHLFDKLGVWSRAQAIVFARDRGFAG
jgi:pimeloyl-ACP methyl ester carboxylesterase/DNA-binding CsgD family transcriptional regulator